MFCYSFLAQQLSRMASKFNIKKLEQQRANVLKAQATIDRKLKEAKEHKRKAEAEKEVKKAKKEEEKRAKLLLKQQAKEGKQEMPSTGGPSNKSFYPVYQKVMIHLAMEFITRMKEDKNPKMYKKFINFIIQHVSTIYTSVRSITIDDVWQTIRDCRCTYLTGEDEEESDADEIINPRDVEKTFKEGELTPEVWDEISKCFEDIAEAHGAVKEAYKSADKPIPKLSTKGMGVFLEALAIGVLTIQDPKVLSILQDTRVNRQMREEMKLSGQVSLINRREDRQKNRMLPDWNHPVFKDDGKYRSVGKVAAFTLGMLWAKILKM